MKSKNTAKVIALTHSKNKTNPKAERWQPNTTANKKYLIYKEKHNENNHLQGTT